MPEDSAPQDSSSFSQAQSFLREASALILQIDEDQRSSAAANIAGQQARIGDLEGALVTTQRAGTPSAQVFAAGNIAYTLASQANLPLALEVIQNSCEGGVRINFCPWCGQNLEQYYTSPEPLTAPEDEQ